MGADFLTGVGEGGGEGVSNRSMTRGILNWPGAILFLPERYLAQRFLFHRDHFNDLEWKCSALSEDGQIYTCFCLLCVNLPVFNYPLSNLPAVKFDPISISCESPFKGTVS